MKKLAALFFPAIVLLGMACEQQTNPFRPEPAEDRSEEDEAAIVDYLAENNLQDEAQRHESGLYYIIEEEGEGATNPTPSSLVLIKYKGYLMDETVFEETEEGDAVQFNLSNEMSGWRIGIPLIKKGGKIKLIIPSNLAYANSPPAALGIPEYAILVFEIELVNFL